MITEQEYIELRGRNERNKAWVDSFRNKSGLACIDKEQQKTCPPDAVISNEERSKIEVYEFCTNPPENYLLYINEETKKATTWTGEILGNVWFGREYRDNFGGTRVPIDVYAINGKKYHGTYFNSAGSYAKIKMYKEK